MDKLSMEEAGYFNCVSVPDGAPSQVSKKELPAEGEVLIRLKLLNSASYFQFAKFLFSPALSLSFWGLYGGFHCLIITITNQAYLFHH